MKLETPIDESVLEIFSKIFADFPTPQQIILPLVFAIRLIALQKEYAALDVVYLHKLKEKLDIMLKREGRIELAKRCFDFLSTRVNLDLNGWNEDIFSH